MVLDCLLISECNESAYTKMINGGLELCCFDSLTLLLGVGDILKQVLLHDEF